MRKEELIKKLSDLEWEDFEVKAAKAEVPKSSWETVSAYWLEYNQTKPVYDLSFDSTIVKFFLETKKDDSQKNVEKSPEELRDNYGVNVEVLRGKYGERCLLIVIVIMRNPFITKQKLSDNLEVSLSTIEKDIKKLRDANFIIREGSDKTGKWVIVKQDNNK